MSESLYGNYRTRTFADVFPSADVLIQGFKSSPLGSFLSENDLGVIWYILSAKYMNSHIALSDENQFIMQVYQLLYAYGPTYVKKMEIQEKLRNLTEDEIMKGTKMIYNHAFNPNSQPSTATLEEIETINDQNTSNTKRSKIQGYSELYSILTTELTKMFVNRFKGLFLKIVEPERPLWYISEKEE